LLVGTLLLCVVRPWLEFLPPNGNTVLRVDSDRAVALSIDDGPHPVFTPAILDILDDPNGDGEADDAVKATFFMTGEHVAAFPRVARQVRDRGHEIGNHGWDDTVLAYMSAASIRKSIDDTDQALREAFGSDFAKPRFVRAAQGRSFLTMAGIIRQQDRVLVSALVLGDDWEEPCLSDPSLIEAKVLERVQAGDIIALHDSDDRESDPAKVKREATVQALPGILAGLDAKGLEVVTIGELLGAQTPVVMTTQPLFWLVLIVLIAAVAYSGWPVWRTPPARNAGA